MQDIGAKMPLYEILYDIVKQYHTNNERNNTRVPMWYDLQKFNK